MNVALGDLLPTFLAAAVVIGMVLFLRRYGGSTALAELERVNGVLDRRVHQLSRENQSLSGENMVLHAKTDLAAAFEPVSQQLHDQHAEAMRKADRSMALLGMIADRLGPEPNGH